MSLKEAIGKEIKMKVGETTHKFSWQEWLKITTDFIEIHESYRTNELSKQKNRFYVITGQDCSPKYKAYPNVQNWVSYIYEIFLNNKENTFNYSFIYVWDTKEETLESFY